MRRRQEDVGTVRGRRERLREQTDRKIMKATLGIVISDGIGAVTIEEVARRSGVAKTTIYRRYRNADDLLQRIQPEVAGLPNFNDLKPSRSGLATMLRRIQDCFDSELGLKAVGVVLSSDNATLKAIAAQPCRIAVPLRLPVLAVDRIVAIRVVAGVLLVGCCGIRVGTVFGGVAVVCRVAGRLAVEGP